MVYMHFPQNLTEEEEFLQKKYAKLRKKRKALAAQRAPKPEPPPAETTVRDKKKSAEAAADATEQAKKLLKAGAIKVEVEKKDNQSFKRTKRQKDSDKPVGFQPFSPTHSSDPEEDRPEPNRSRMKGLYDSFVSPTESRFEREREREREPREREREHRERRDSREPPKKGNTVYVHGLGITEELLRKSFSNLGTIVNVSLEREKNCAFVTFEQMESAEQAITEMNGSVVSNIPLKVSMARRQPAFDTSGDTSSQSWSSIAANQSQKGFHRDKRNLVTYDEEDDIF